MNAPIWDATVAAASLVALICLAWPAWQLDRKARHVHDLLRKQRQPGRTVAANSPAQDPWRDEEPDPWMVQAHRMMLKLAFQWSPATSWLLRGGYVLLILVQVAELWRASTALL